MVLTLLSLPASKRWTVHTRGLSFPIVATKKIAWLSSGLMPMCWDDPCRLVSQPCRTLYKVIPLTPLTRTTRLVTYAPHVKSLRHNKFNKKVSKKDSPVKSYPNRNVKSKLTFGSKLVQLMSIKQLKELITNHLEVEVLPTLRIEPSHYKQNINKEIRRKYLHFCGKACHQIPMYSLR